jgi:ABC-type spermidine/putrescine transport system permease subunit I
MRVEPRSLRGGNAAEQGVAVETRGVDERVAPERRPVELFLLLPAVVVVIVTILVPLGMTVAVSFWSRSGFVLERAWSTETYSDLLRESVFWSTLGETALTVLIVVLGALLIAYPVAYYIAMIVPERWRIPLFIAAIIPFWTSYLTRMETFFPLLGREGVVNQGLGVVGLGPYDVLLFSRPAQWAVMILLYALFAVGPIFFTLARMDPALLEASSTLGAGSLATFRRVTLPTSMPGILTGAGFVVIMVVQDFASPLFIGGAKRILLANDVVLRASILDWPGAAAVATVLSVLTLALVIALFHLARIRQLV